MAETSLDPTRAAGDPDFVPPTPELLYERRGAVAFLTFNRPAARNAMTFAMYEGLYAACEHVDGRGHPPQQKVDPRLDADRRVRDGSCPLKSTLFEGRGEPATIVVPCVVGLPSPGGIQSERERLDVGRGGGQPSSPSQVAISAAA